MTEELGELLIPFYQHPSLILDLKKSQNSMITKRTQTVWWINEQTVAKEVGLTLINPSISHLSPSAGLSTPSPSSHVTLLLTLFLVIHSRFPSHSGGLEHHHNCQQGRHTLISDATPLSSHTTLLTMDATPSAGMPHPPAARPSSLYP